MGFPPVTDDFTTRLQDALGAAYTLEGELGGGGMSRVYLARQTALGREVVLKVLPPELTSSVNLERFRREIQYAAQLQHPHIVPLLTAGESGDLLWYTMPRIPGESLRAVLERRGALPAEEVVQILRDVADALGTAHQRGLVHRDIKPENILLQGEHALVTDFGVAKAISAALPGSGATAVGVAIGTPAYMAPEQVAGDPAADHRIDLYALGLLAYELLTGSTPFRGTSPHQTMAAHLIRQPTPPDAMRAGLPPGLSALVMRCLQKDPDQRYPDAAALISDLRQISEGSGAGLPIPSRQRGSGAARPARRILAATGLVASALIAGYLLAVSLAPTAAEAPLPDTSTAAPPPAAPVAPAGLTLADSVAIAEAVERRLAAQQTAAANVTRAMLDSIRREITQAVTDSVRQSLPLLPGTQVVVGGDPRGEPRAFLPGGRGGSPGDAPPPPGTPGAPARLVVVPLEGRQQGGSALGATQAILLDGLADALARAPGVEVVEVAGRADSLLRRGLPAEVVARSAAARFFVTMNPVRRRDSVSFTITVHDLDARFRQMRTIQTPFLPIAEAGASMSPRVTAQVAEVVAAMQAVTARRQEPRPRPPPRPDSGGA